MKFQLQCLHFLSEKCIWKCGIENIHPFVSASMWWYAFLLISGNNENLEEIKQNLDFSYVRVLKMMYSQNPLVRLLAGAALAAFAYNSLTNQKDIAEQGGVRFNCFVPFLQSEDEFFRCNAAFQVGVFEACIENRYIFNDLIFNFIPIEFW